MQRHKKNVENFSLVILHGVSQAMHQNHC